MHPNLKSPIGLVAAFAALLCFACSDDHDHDADAEACEHLEGGPSVAITASADDATAPAIAPDHKRYDITFVALAADYGGKVKLEAEAGDYILFLDADVPLTVKALATGAPVTPESAAKSSATCARVKGRHQIPIAVAGT